MWISAGSWLTNRRHLQGCIQEVAGMLAPEHYCATWLLGRRWCSNLSVQSTFSETVLAQELFVSTLYLQPWQDSICASWVVDVIHGDGLSCVQNRHDTTHNDLRPAMNFIEENSRSTLRSSPALLQAEASRHHVLLRPAFLQGWTTHQSWTVQPRSLGATTVS